VARGAATRNKRAKPDAHREPQRSRQNVRVEDQNLFFPSLRRQAKWVFALLAVVFAAGFVFFGVGSGSSGLGDLFRGDFGSIFGGGGGDPISKLQKDVAKHPQDAAAWLKLARALEGKSRTDEAVTALETYTALRPKDANGWQELAGLYLTQAQNYYTELLNLQSQLASLPSAGIGVAGDSFLNQEFQKNPLYAALLAELNTRYSDLQTKLSGTLRQREGAYERAVNALPAADPGLPGVVFAWARAATDAQDYATAIKAYKRYLKLAPDSGLAADARKEIKRLEGLVKSQTANQG